MPVRVATVTLNPAIDQTISIPNFAVGQVNRVEWEQADPGGKGVNVAAFLADFGNPVSVTGFLGAGNTEIFRSFFAAKGIDDHFVTVPGRTRANVKILDQPNKRITDINLPGLPFSPENLASLQTVIDRLAADHDWFVLSGSTPAGTPDTVYADLVAGLRRRGKRVVLDASGPAFAKGVEALPYAVKPNLEELEELTGRTLPDETAILAAVQDLIDRGIGCIAVSLGPDGAIFAEGAERIATRPPAVVVRSTVGAGDAMVAGFVLGKLRGLELEGCARLASAFSLGTLATVGPHLPPPESVEQSMGEIDVRVIAH
jgi:1-phosphofructokinase family hexose kinase